MWILCRYICLLYILHISHLGFYFIYLCLFRMGLSYIVCSCEDNLELQLSSISMCVVYGLLISLSANWLWHAFWRTLCTLMCVYVFVLCNVYVCVCICDLSHQIRCLVCVFSSFKRVIMFVFYLRTGANSY